MLLSFINIRGYPRILKKYMGIYITNTHTDIDTVTK